MARRRRLLTSLSSLAVSAALALGGCGGAEDAVSASADERAGNAPAEPVEMKLGETAEEDAGVIGRETSASDGDAMSPEDERMSYFARLMLISGQARATSELYRGGDAGMAYEGAVWPKDKIYLELKPLFEKYEAPGFEIELDDFNRSIKEGEPEEEVEKRLIEVRNAIDENIWAASPTAPELLLATSHVVRTAGKEYSESVKDGDVVKPLGYAAARGVLTVAVETLGGVEGETAAAKDAIAFAREQASAALGATADVKAMKMGGKSAALVFAAADEIEYAALNLEKR